MTAPDSMIERVARALIRKREGYEAAERWEREDRGGWHFALAEARVAIEAMRSNDEPPPQREDNDP